MGHLIYLIGFMGSGKSTTGRKVAAGMGWSFVDLDDKIEKEIGLTIPEIFSNYGENYFRDAETRILRSFKYLSDTVISTGGGAPCFNDNMKFMLETGLTIYLKLTPAQLRSRLELSVTERPLIKGLKGNDLENYINGKLEEREPWYGKAEIVIDGTWSDYSSLVKLIKKHLEH